jgi:hypothetical protein
MLAKINALGHNRRALDISGKTSTQDSIHQIKNSAKKFENAARIFLNYFFTRLMQE